MCRTIHCFERHEGHGQEINSLSELLGMIAQMAPQEPESKQDHAEWLKSIKANLEATARATEIALLVLDKEPPEPGSKLVGLEVLRPSEPEKRGVLTIATYAMESGVYRVDGIDHLTQGAVSHTTPNKTGLRGLVAATKEELEKQSDEAVQAEADAAQAAA